MAPRKSKTPRRSSTADGTNGTPQADGRASYASPSRPKTDWTRIDAATFSGFKIQYHPSQNISKKRKHDEDLPQLSTADHQLQQNPFKPAPLPDTLYSVKPPQLWDDTSRYRKFTSKSTYPTLDL